MIGAISASNSNWPVPRDLLEHFGLCPSNPQVPRSKELMTYTQALENFAVPDRLSMEEAATIYDLWHKDNALHTRMSLFLSLKDLTSCHVADSNDELFLSKYTEACGNARRFVWDGLLRTMTT